MHPEARQDFCLNIHRVYHRLGGSGGWDGGEKEVCVWGARACVFWRDPVQWFSPVCYCQLLSNLCSCTELHWRWFSRRINAGVLWLTMKLFLMLIVIVILVAASAPDPVIPHWYCCSINRESTWKCMSGRQRHLLVMQSLMLLWPLALSSLHAAPFKISNAATSQWCRSTAAVLPSPLCLTPIPSSIPLRVPRRTRLDAGNPPQAGVDGLYCWPLRLRYWSCLAVVALASPSSSSLHPFLLYYKVRIIDFLSLFLTNTSFCSRSDMTGNLM